jgi:S1-C subfamily serine protease
VVSFSPENKPAVTQGIVSSIADNRIRLNVWIVPGASGSPVVDESGRMVGLIRGAYTGEQPMVVQFQDRAVTGSGYVWSSVEAPSSGMAVAVPIDIVKDIYLQIKEKGKVERGWLGVSIGQDADGNVVIVSIDRDSPAEDSDLKKGDVILELDGRSVDGSGMLGREIRKKKPGETIRLRVERKGRETTVRVKLGEYPESELHREFELLFPNLFTPRPPRAPRAPEAPDVPSPALPRGFMTWTFGAQKYIGVSIEELNEELSAFFGVKEGKGLLVSKIKEDSPAEKAGLKVGDVIVAVDGKRVETFYDLARRIQKKDEGETVTVEYIRDKRTKKADVKVEEEKGRRSRGFSFSSDLEDLTKDSLFFREKDSDDFTKVLKRMKEKSKSQSDDVLKFLKKRNDIWNKKYTNVIRVHRSIKV